MIRFFLAVMLLTGSLQGAVLARDCATLRTLPDGTAGIHVTGGKQGHNDWYIVDLTDGTVCIQRLGQKSDGRLTGAEIAHLKGAVESAGFFGWKAEYLPNGRAADGMSTTITFNDGGRRHSVVWADAAIPPAGFQALARRFELLGYPPYWHSVSYMYLSGQLQHSDLEGGFWTVAYASQDAASRDKYGGKVVLEIDKRLLNGFKAGDLVFVTGGIDTERMGIQMAGTYFKVQKLEHLR